MQNTLWRTIATTAACCLILTAAAPAFNGLHVPFVGADKAWAKGKGSGKGKGGADAADSALGTGPGKSASAKGRGKSSASASSSSSSSSKGKGKDVVGELLDSVFGTSQKSKATKASRQKKSTLVTAVPEMRPQKMPQAVVRQYALTTGMKQGELARALKSWNSLNRNMQAYLANMNNPKSLPGLQIAYVRENLKTQAALEAFIAAGGDPSSPPTEAAYTAAQGVLAAEAATPGTYTAEEVKAAQTVVEQYEAWSEYSTAAGAAEEAFAAASVSYSSSVDPQTMVEVRSYVDGIIEMKGLDTLVSEYDEAAAASESTTTATAE
jgi:hypothetical protein